MKQQHGSVSMLDFSKEDALLATEQFVYGFEQWSSLFTLPLNKAYEVDDKFQNYNGDKRPEHHAYDDETAQRLRKTTLYILIDTVFDFAEKGEWNGVNTFSAEDRKAIEASLIEALTEFCIYDEVFRKADKQHLIFFGFNAGDDYLAIKVNGKYIMDIINQVIEATWTRHRMTAAQDLTLEDVAFLSGLNIKTVRNAASSKNNDRISGVDGNSIDYIEAIRWLKTKKGFTGPYFIDDEVQYEVYETLSQFKYHCESLLAKKNVLLDIFAKEASLDVEVTKALKKLFKLKVGDTTEIITPEILKVFGERLDVNDLETFVREGSKILASSVAEFKVGSLFS